ncbi:ABC transporter G family member 23 [Amborella trichopoda]|uniref:ABC transporter domain-containing protein n=1 Tax=Amborella trichopoda TaxID=13333 RepID=U5CSQ2_AMBTC|nr:ABC transporter G family member 23 [Amborella trichopoda]ERN16276.1 hypothetical protein AMTR_s00063p00178530 [Amborella trichopoda]|eukprot:XP_006854809.1 ABC transporter G family member 23 [Amborella trichopoda]
MAPSDTYDISAHNLSYSIPTPLPLPFSLLPFSLLPHHNKPKPLSLLKNISFHAKPHRLLAVVGPSGAGKSSLLHLISGRACQTSQLTRGAILLNGLHVSAALLRHTCGFVPQQDALLPLLTVQETLIYAARLKLHVTRRKAESRVRALMEELGLVRVSDSLVGSVGSRGVSGGERRRVSVGSEVVHDPPILILDEPTTGLDSRAAFNLIQTLRAMARSKGRTIVLSIHQPSYKILDIIDEFLLLSHGELVFNGTLKALRDLITVEMGLRIPAQINTLEYAMEIIKTLESAIKENPISQNPVLEVRTPNFETPDLKSLFGFEPEIKTSHDYGSRLNEVVTLCSRFWKIIYRTNQLLMARSAQAIVAGLGLGSVYFKTKRNRTGVAEILGFFAFSLSFLLSSTTEALPIFLQERKVLMREASRKFYRVSSYLIANTLVFAPFLLLIALLYAGPVYWLVGLNPSFQAFAFFVMVIWGIVLMANSLVLFLSAISPDFITGNSLICLVLGVFFLFSGYFISKENIPKYWIFMYYLSLYKYPLDLLLINEYGGKDRCLELGGSFENRGMSGGCLLRGDDVLKGRGLREGQRWVNVGVVVGFFLLYRFLCWVVLLRRVSRTRM